MDGGAGKIFGLRQGEGFWSPAGGLFSTPKSTNLQPPVRKFWNFLGEDVFKGRVFSPIHRGTYFLMACRGDSYLFTLSMGGGGIFHDIFFSGVFKTHSSLFQGFFSFWDIWFFWLEITRNLPAPSMIFQQGEAGWSLYPEKSKPLAPRT